MLPVGSSSRESAAALRDDAILVALVAEPLPVATIAVSTGMGERRVQRGLARLIAADYIFVARRGLYRLTARGRAVLPESPTRIPEPAARRPARPPKPARPADRPLDLTL